MPGSYRQLLESGEFAARVSRAKAALPDCSLCPRACHADRTENEGECGGGRLARVDGWGAHFGEEDVLRGSRGSGTVFFAGCNLHCVFCQNWTTSQAGEGKDVEAQELADIFLALEDQRCHNLNLVSPSHFVPQILESLFLAAEEGLTLPVVWNSGGYDGLSALKLLDGIVDIYMPDIKYADDESARRLSGAEGYVAASRAAVLEMHRQVGDLTLDKDGLAVRGLLVRHLVLPGGLAATAGVLEFLANKVSRNTYVNLMDQYRPAFRASSHPPLNRRPQPEELEEAFSAAARAGLTRLDRRRFRAF